MNKSRRISLINMIVSFALIALEAVGVYFFATTSKDGFGVMDLKYYTVLTVFVTMLGSALMIWANIISFIKKRDCTPRIFYSIRFLSAVMSLITLVTVAAFLAPTSGSTDVIFSLQDGFIFMHFICPIVSIFQFIGLEIEPKGKFRKTFEPFIATVIYGIAILVTVFVIKTKDVQEAANFGPYFFFWVTDDLIEAGKSVAQDVVAHPETMTLGFNIGVLVGVLGISYVMSVILWTLNRISHNIFIGEVIQAPVPKAKTAKGKKKEEPTKKGGNAFTRFVKNQVAFGDNSANPGQTYHISYHDRRLKTWKVKTENAGRALKVFNTQKEAIAFANQCVKKNGGSIRVHSMMGKIRKE